MDGYEPARTITVSALVSLRSDCGVSTHRLEGELKRVTNSPIVLNRRLREVVTQTLAKGDLTMSEIAIRCGRTKCERRGNVSGETSLLARRIGQLPEGGESEPSRWVHNDVLASSPVRALASGPARLNSPSGSALRSSPLHPVVEHRFASNARRPGVAEGCRESSRALAQNPVVETLGFPAKGALWAQPWNETPSLGPGSGQCVSGKSMSKPYTLALGPKCST